LFLQLVFVGIVMCVCYISLNITILRVLLLLGMFTYDKKSRFFWFSTVPCENFQEFNLVGVVSFLSAII